AGDSYINNSTSTKQLATSSSGVVVLASDNTSGYYMHNVIAPTAAAPPDTVISSGPPASTSSTSATFAFTSSAAGSTFACSLDGIGPGTSGPTVSGAKLRLTVGSSLNDNADKGGEFRAAVNSNWSESSVTWATVPAAAAGAPVAAITSTVALNSTYLVDVSPL